MTKYRYIVNLIRNDNNKKITTICVDLADYMDEPYVEALVEEQHCGNFLHAQVVKYQQLYK